MSGPQSLAEFLGTYKEQAQSKKWRDAGLSPLCIVYYTYWENFHHEPSDVFEMLKGYSYFILTRGL